MNRLLDLLRPRPVAAVPLSRTIDLEAPFVSADPFPAYERLRREGDVVYLERHGIWLVLGYDAAKEAFAAPLRFSSAPYEFVDKAMLSVDPPHHGPVRKIVSRTFAGEALRRAGHLAGETAAALVGPELEVVSEFARPISRKVAADLIGFDAETVEAIAAVEDANEAAGAPDAFERTCAVLDAVAPRARLFERFREDGAALLGVEEVRSLVRLLWLASTATTERTIAHAILRLAEDSELFARLRGDPRLVSSLVEEILRLYPPESLIRRRAVRATELAGTNIPAGAELNICLPAANRDPAVFEAPDELRLERSNGANLSFGSGIHHCVGAPMTRRVVREAIGAFVSGCEAPRLVGEVTWIHAMIVRAPREFRIAC